MRADARYRLLSGIVRLWTAGPFVDLRVRGSEHIPTTGRVLIACNHPSMLNTLVPWAILDRNPSVLVIHHAFKVPVLGHILRSLGNIPVRRDVRLPWLHRDHSLARAAAAKAAVDVLTRGGVVQLYPEGKIAGGWMGRRKDVIQDLAPGVARIARVTGSPIVPFGIRLGWRVGRRGVQHTIRIEIGPAILAAGSPGDVELLDEVRAALRRLSGHPDEEAGRGTTRLPVASLHPTVDP